MFRASFPSASDEQEKAESSWVKANFDLTGANRSGKSRFAGTWISPDTAKFLAESYRLGPIIDALSDANPDPNVVYRKSSKTGQTPTGSPASAVVPAQSQQGAAGAVATPTQPPAAKRRREASPSNIPVRSTPTRSQQQVADVPTWTPLTPASSTVATTTSSTTLAATSKTTRAPTTSPAATRRSARLKSPAPAAPAQPKTPRASRAAAREKEREERGRETPAGSDETAVDHDHEDANEAAKVADISMSEDIREQKELIERLKKERAKKEKGRSDEMDEDEDEENGLRQKRGREEKEEYTLNIKEPEMQKRAIATNRRITGMSPQNKSLVWGAFLFAFGMGAMYVVFHPIYTHACIRSKIRMLTLVFVLYTLQHALADDRNRRLEFLLA